MKRLVWWLALVLVACQPPQHWQEIVNLPTPLPRGGTLIYAIDEEISVLQPWNVQNRAVEVVTALMHAGLTRLDVRGQPQAELAESWQVDESGTVLTVTLKPDLRWSDGQSLTANDVVFTYQALLAIALNSPVGRELEVIREVVSASPTVVEFRLREPYSPLLTLWALPILPRHVLLDQSLAEINLRTLTVGAGPFALSEGQTEDEWQLVANQYYHRGVPLFDAISLQLRRSPEEIATLMDSSDPFVIDTRHDVDTTNRLVSTYAQNSVLSVAFNMRPDRVLTTLPLRHELIRLAEQGGHFADTESTLEPVHQLPLRGNWLEVPELNTHSDILDEQLAQQGWEYDDSSKMLTKNGEPLQLTVVVQMDEPRHVALARFLVQKWQRVGVEVNLQLLTRQAYLTRLTAPYAYDVAIVEWAHGRSNSVYADTLFYDPTGYWLFASDELNKGMPDTSGSLNIVGMDDENYDMLAKSALATYDVVGRLNAERSAHIRVNDVAPYYFVAREHRTIIRSPRIASVNELPSFATPWYLAGIDAWYQLP